MESFIDLASLVYEHRAFLAGEALGEGMFPTPSLTPLSLKLDYSNFVQNYFGIRRIFCDKKIRIKLIMTSL